MYHRSTHIFELVCRLNKYQLKLDKFLNAPDKNKRIIHRIRILRNKIIRIFNLLRAHSLKFALSCSISGLMAVSTHGQSFGPQQLNPFGFTNQVFYDMPTFVDIDADGDYDCFTGDWLGDIQYYENTGSNTAPVLTFMSTNPFGLLGYYTYASPTFVDIDADGDFDLFVGYYNYGNILFFENTGSNTAPAFAFPLLNPFGLTGNGSYFAFPDFADFDDDGDYDLIEGDYYGNFYYFKNTGSPTSPVFTSMQFNPFGLSANGYYWSTAAIADIDCDGDYDLFCGRGGLSNVVYYENIGSVNTPAFAAPQINPFGILPSYTYLSPAFSDIDADGDLDLFCGNENGDLLFFENTELNNPPSIAAIGDTSICRNDTAWVNITVSDECLYYLNTTGYSDNQSLIPDANISITGNGSTRYLTAVPLNGQTGVAHITVVAIDAGNKQDSTGFNINVIGPEASFTVSDTSVCAGDSVYFTNTSTNASTFEWLVDGNQAATTTDFAASWNVGTYTVHLVADSSACGADTSNGTMVSVYANPSFTLSVTADNGNCDGTATVTASGGTPPYTYQWDANAGNQTTQTADSLCVGTYCVTVTDSKGCTADSCADITLGMDQLSDKIALFMYPNPGNGVFTVHVITGQPLYAEFSLLSYTGRIVHREQLESVTGCFQKTFDFSFLPAGVYCVRIGEATGIITITK